jgi:pimeloyl-ACP methyl ester carboxylesterase
VLIGHSLGGMVAQLCLGRQPLAGLVLMAAVPFEGLIPAQAQLAMRDPALWLELINLPAFGPRVPATVSPRLRRALFADELPRGAAERHLARMQHISLRALAEVQLPRLCDTANNLRIPAFVIGREDDRLIPLDAMQRTAWLHRAELRALPGCAHMTMLEARWRDSAEALTDWLERTFG